MKIDMLVNFCQQKLLCTNRNVISFCKTK